MTRIHKQRIDVYAKLLKPHSSHYKKNKYSKYLMLEYVQSIIDLAEEKKVITEDGYHLLNTFIPYLKRTKLISIIVGRIKQRICQDSLDRYYDEKNEEKLDGILKYLAPHQKHPISILMDDYRKLIRQLPCLHHFNNHANHIFSVDKEMKSFFWDKARKIIQSEQKRIKKFENDVFYQRLQQVVCFYQLNVFERKILEFLYEMQIDSSLSSFIGHYTGETIISYTQFVAKFLNVPISKFRSAIKSKSKLLKMGIVEIVDSELKINIGIQNYLSEMGENSLLENFIRKDLLDNTLPVEDLLNEKKFCDLLKKLIKKGKEVNILFYGAPGSGKTSLAKSLAKELGRNLYFVNELNQSNKEDSNTRKIYLRTANEILDPKKDLLVVDECDQIIQTVNSWMNYGTVVDKSWINQFLTENKVPIIWISNSISNMEESTKRRFSFSIRFKAKTKDELRKVWINQIKDLGIASLSSDDIGKLVMKYDVSPGAIGLAAKNLNFSEKKFNKEKILNELELVLKAHQELISNKKHGGDLNDISPFYDLKHVTSDVDLAQMIETLKNYERNKHYLNSMIPNQNILLSGPPGVGKTELCKYLARELGKPLILKRASDLLGMYVGQSEQQIASAFQEATDSGSILFIDEVDSLLQDRSHAQRSWEISQVNEILTWLENHKTICLMATNYLDKTDSALLRRMNFKIKLGYLTSEGVEFFYHKIFSTLAIGTISESLTHQIRHLKNITPGDMKAVYQRVALSGKVDHEEIMRELQLESNYKKNRDNSGRKIGLWTEQNSAFK